MFREKLEKYKMIILYIVFGVLTTIINLVVYWVLYEQCKWTNIASNIVAWIFAVIFAFITNKSFVFKSKGWTFQIVLIELWKFIICRLTTGVLDLVIMYIGVDLLHGPSLVLKIASNVIVIIFNYVASKMIIFE